ncbi:hypothetical protein FA09DRAFT_242498 [Tilletiopsis washingtonensis]|jgi:hypothetical protein|uniref:Uncharacterized protein n=1 Tax=Tilletiopsis washingtonensis TaxID=58919 RepID=A0A316ZC64_9BASI|nr:hypothetical protein FA09DRAFT_242498 [Tilletiopsis washingtonensis]PWN99119.1 hypothetical protein FA09DRAFT_242498 [Tilletiopsis washingtonensis]
MEQPHSASADGPPRTSLSTAAGASIRCVLPLESPAGQPDAVIVLREDAVLCALPEDVQLQLAAAPRCTPYPEAPSGAEPGKGPKRRKLHGSREDVFAPLAVRAAALIPPESLSLSARLRVQQAAQEHDWQNEERLAEQSSAADAAALPPLLVSETQKRCECTLARARRNSAHADHSDSL